jgi:hypothetical protein
MTKPAVHRPVELSDEQGRFAPKFGDSELQMHDASLGLVEAIGRAADHAFLGESLTEALEWTRNRVQVDVDGSTSENAVKTQV